MIKKIIPFLKGSKTGSYATIQKKKDSKVPVCIWEITPMCESRLDMYEGYPNFYYKKNLEVDFNGRKINTMVYIMHEDKPYGISSIK